jgi:hypothetical protein
MQRWLTGADLVNTLAMLRTVDNRTFVIVEGISDCQALDPHVADTSAATFPAHSKSAAAEAIKLADQREIQKVLAILDRDWVGSLATPLASSNVVYTDDYDLDATIIFSDAIMEKVLSSESDRDIRASHLAGLSVDARGLVTKIAGEAGIIRYASQEHQMSLRCRGLPVHQALAPAHDALDLEALATIVIGRSPHCSVTKATVVSVVQAKNAADGDLRTYCSGHDLACVMAALIRRWGGSASQHSVEKAVRAALSCADLKLTKLFAGTMDWCESVGVTIWSCT